MGLTIQDNNKYNTTTTSKKRKVTEVATALLSLVLILSMMTNGTNHSSISFLAHAKSGGHNNDKQASNNNTHNNAQSSPSSPSSPPALPPGPSSTGKSAHFVNPRLAQQQTGGGTIERSGGSNPLPNRSGINQPSTSQLTSAGVGGSSARTPASGTPCRQNSPGVAAPICPLIAKISVNSLEDGSNSVISGHYVVLNGCESVGGMEPIHRYSFSSDFGNVSNPNNSCIVSVRSPLDIQHTTLVQYRLNVTDGAINSAIANATIFVVPTNH